MAAAADCEMLHVLASVNPPKIGRLAWNTCIWSQELLPLRHRCKTQLFGREGIAQKCYRIALAGPKIALGHHSPSSRIRISCQDNIRVLSQGHECLHSSSCPVSAAEKFRK